MVKEIEDFDTALDNFRKLMWLCAPRKVGIRNSGQSLARLVLFQLGSL
jgi:hypothetical protein